MADRLMQALCALDEVERTARRRSPLKQIDARAKAIVTIVFLCTMLSMPIDRLSELMLFTIYPLLAARMGGMNYAAMVRNSLLVVPFAALIALPNIFYDRVPMFLVGELVITRGWISLVSIILRGVLSVQAVMVWIGSTGTYQSVRALQRLGMPSLFASQIFLTMRYIRLIIDQALQMRRARDARSFGRQSYPLRLWAMLVGELLLRSVKRGEAIGYAMAARGFESSMPAIALHYQDRWRRRDTLYTILCSTTLILIRILHLSERIF